MLSIHAGLLTQYSLRPHQMDVCVCLCVYKKGGAVQRFGESRHESRISDTSHVMTIIKYITLYYFKII